MNIEEKAKRYDEALKKAQELYYHPNSSNIGKEYVYTVFPELTVGEKIRFHEGDWIIHNERKNKVKIIKTLPFYYKVVDIFGNHHTIEKETAEKNYHPWTVRDAKDGDGKDLEKAKKKKNLDRAVEAFRWACPDSTILTRLDRTKEVYECFAVDCEKRKYRCKGNICPRLRKFINILKEPEQ